MGISRSLVGLGLVTALVGCHDPAAGLYGVSGTVRFKSEPLRNATIRFVSTAPDSQEARGTLINDGAYSIPRTRGLTPGSYKVWISAADEKVKVDGPPGPESNRLSGELIPADYNVKTKLVIEVRADGDNKFDFEIR